VLSGTNQIFIGASNKTTNISGNVNIATTGIPATGRVNIGTGTNNVADSQVQIGSETISTVLVKGVNIVMNDQSGTKVQIGAKELGVMYLRGQTVYINDG
jgi:hypothetical protein